MPFDGTELSQTKRDLIAARELLIDKGWVPHCGTGNLAGPNCLQTSVTAVTGFDWVRAERGFRMIYHVLRPLGYREIVPFNDSQASIEPVLELLDRAIAAS